MRICGESEIANAPGSEWLLHKEGLAHGTTKRANLHIIFITSVFEMDACAGTPATALSTTATTAGLRRGPGEYRVQEVTAHPNRRLQNESKSAVGAKTSIWGIGDVPGRGSAQLPRKVGCHKLGWHDGVILNHGRHSN